MTQIITQHKVIEGKSIMDHNTIDISLSVTDTFFDQIVEIIKSEEFQHRLQTERLHTEFGQRWESMETLDLKNVTTPDFFSLYSTIDLECICGVITDIVVTGRKLVGRWKPLGINSNKAKFLLIQHPESMEFKLRSIAKGSKILSIVTWDLVQKEG